MVFTTASRAAIRAAEKYWIWKFSLRLLSIVFCIVGIGCTAGVIPIVENPGIWAIIWSLIPFSCAIIWNGIALIVLITRKRPVHPGVAVGLDLILWLGFIVTGFFATYAALDTIRWWPSYYDSSSNYDGGHYGYAPNGTYIWIPDDNPCAQYEGGCAERDAILGRIRHVAIVEFVAAACTFIAVILHIALFVWACIDTHARNSNRTQRKARAIADALIAEMQQRGQIQLATQPLLPQPRVEPGPEPAVMSGGAGNPEIRIDPPRTDANTSS